MFARTQWCKWQIQEANAKAGVSDQTGGGISDFCGTESRTSGTESRTSGTESRTSGTESRTSGTESRTN